MFAFYVFAWFVCGFLAARMLLEGNMDEVVNRNDTIGFWAFLLMGALSLVCILLAIMFFAVCRLIAWTWNHTSSLAKWTHMITD